MEDILDEAASVVQCKECSWYKACVLPMRLSVDDMRKQMPPSLPGAGMMNDELLGALAASAQALILEGCPVFIKRLRSSLLLAERVKKMMQNWGTAPED